jgi:hypothetical protein
VAELGVGVGADDLPQQAVLRLRGVRQSASNRFTAGGAFIHSSSRPTRDIGRPIRRA